MPRATSNITETERHDLKTCEGGYVEVRRLSYGEKLQRRAMVSGMKVNAEKGKRDFQGEMNLVNEQATLFDFSRCILSHNLEDDMGNLLDFKNGTHVKSLDPRIGEEIDEILSNMNNYEDDEGN